MGTNDILNILTTLLTILKRALDSTYFKQPIPCEIDEKINLILDDFTTYDAEQIKSIIDAIDIDNARVLGLFAERMASLAVRENNPVRVKQGLIGLAMYSRTVDPRDVLLVLSLLYDASVRISVDPKEMFEDVGSIIEGADFFKDFLCRSEDDKSIEAMGYEGAINKGDFIYTRTW